MVNSKIWRQVSTLITGHYYGRVLKARKRNAHINKGSYTNVVLIIFSFLCSCECSTNVFVILWPDYDLEAGPKQVVLSYCWVQNISCVDIKGEFQIRYKNFLAFVDEDTRLWRWRHKVMEMKTQDYGDEDTRLWRWRQKVMEMKTQGYGDEDTRLWRWRHKVMEMKTQGYGDEDTRLWRGSHKVMEIKTQGYGDNL
jgi:hypothetical protein